MGNQAENYRFLVPRVIILCVQLYSDSLFVKIYNYGDQKIYNIHNFAGAKN